MERQDPVALLLGGAGDRLLDLGERLEVLARSRNVSPRPSLDHFLRWRLAADDHVSEVRRVDREPQPALPAFEPDALLAEGDDPQRLRRPGGQRHHRLQRRAAERATERPADEVAKLGVWALRHGLHRGYSTARGYGAIG